MRRRILPVMLVLVAIYPSEGRAQAPSAASSHEQQLAAQLRRLAETIRKARGAGQTTVISPERDQRVIELAMAVKPESTRVWALLEEGRTDKQVGAGSSAAGSTSLVSKGGVPAILGIALENGALERSQSGTTLTFRTTPTAMVRALGNHGYLATYEPNDPALNVLQKLSLTASFDTARGQPENQPTFTADSNQLSTWGARLTVVDHRDPRRAAYDDTWIKEVGDVNQQLLEAEDTFYEALRRPRDAVGLRYDPVFEVWLAGANSAIAAAPDAQLESAIEEQFRLLPSLPVAAGVRQALTPIVTAHDRVLAARRRVLDRIDRGAQFVIDYTNDRPTTGFYTSNVRLVGSVGGTVNLTGNTSASFFNGARPTGVTRRMRDVQAAVQLDVPMGRPDSLGRYLLSFAYKLDYLLTDIPGPAGTILPATKGPVSVGQLKLTIPIKDSAAKIPLSVTFANRSELIKERVVRGNIGVTYDLDAVFARFKP